MNSYTLIFIMSTGVSLWCALGYRADARRARRKYALSRARYEILHRAHIRAIDDLDDLLAGNHTHRAPQHRHLSSVQGEGA